MTAPDTDARPPAAALRPYISGYAGFRARGLDPGFIRGLPSRHLTLMIGLSGPFRIERAGSFAAFVAGLHDAPAIVERTAEIEALHVFLKPLAATALFGLPPAALARTVVCLDDVMGGAAVELQERLHETRSWSRRFVILDGVFTRLLRPYAPAPELSWSWRRLLLDAGTTRISRLAEEVGWSRRHLTERFRNEYGVTPKAVARTVRFEHACALIKQHRVSLARVAVAAGFHDQPHMTREWKALAGCAPKAWIAEELPFLQDYELAGLEYLG